MTSLDCCYNIRDLRKRAKKKLPAPMFHYIDGGSDDELSLRRNTEAFDDYELMPNYLRNIETIDLSTDVLGTKLNMPFFLAPTGMSRLFHHEKEIAVCKAAETFGTMYSLSTLATTSIEEIAACSSAAKMFQVYILKDRELTREFVVRCKNSGYNALCLTIDTPLAGNRERDLVNGMSMPPKFTVNGLLSYLTHFEWVFNLLRNPGFKLANVAHRVDILERGTLGLIDYVNSQFDRTINWSDAQWLAQQWDGPFVIKGIQSPSDALKAIDIGATALMISNHGGRQLDGVPAPIDCIAAIRDAVGDNVEIIVDGGIRRGTHILKALAMGANACSIGRPYLYGLAAGGQKGVEKALSLLKEECTRSMALLGCRSIRDITSQHVQHKYAAYKK